jgi:hypothetical protein
LALSVEGTPDAAETARVQELIEVKARARELIEVNGAMAQRRVAARSGVESVPG